jgi:hypothetical protein
MDNKLLIAIPIKSEQKYVDRMNACRNTWLSCVPDADSRLNPPLAYKAFSDAELGLDPNSPTVRPWRTKLMCKYALENGYDYIFRTDSDAYVWVNRLLASGFEQHDYMGWCLDYPKHLEKERGLRTAHGGIGFFLSRRAMEIVANTEPWKQEDGIYWGDIWTGEVLWKHGIYCHRDTRFLDGSNGDPTGALAASDIQHHGNIFADELPETHPYIAVHPVPAENMYEIHERFNDLPAGTTPPERQLWWSQPNWNIGEKQPDICPCEYCQTLS